MRPTLRMALLFGGLFIAILVVHQQVRLEAANFLLTGTYTPESVLAEWHRAGYGTRILLQLFTAGALVTLVLSSLRLAQGHGQRAMTSSEALPPLTAVLKDLKDQEATQRQEKRAAIAQVSEMRAIQSTILEGISSGVVTVDGEGRLATCNPAACAILEWRAVPPIGRPVADLFRGGLPEGLIDPAAPPRRVEFIWRRGAQPKHLGLSLSPIQTPAGRLTAVLFTDLTQVKRLKRQVEMRRHLAQLGEVSAGIAHEFRNNMGAVLGYARLIAHDTPADSPTREVVDAMMAELTGMEHLIRDLLDFSRKDELNPSRVELAPLVRHAVEVARADFDDVEVTLCLGTELPPLSADEARLRQGVINLVRNACEAVQGMPAGTGRVTVTAQAEAAEPGRPAEWVTVSVADNGPGVDDGARPKIFLPFFTTKESGTGMGLPHVHKTVTAHGGDVTLIPTPGGGATFRLRLPTVHRRPGPLPEAPEDVL